MATRAGTRRRRDTDPEQRLRTRLRAAYEDEIDRTHRSLLLAWAGFAVTFGLLRALTYGIRHDLVPWGNVTPGGLHIHHYVWGIGLLLLVGLISLVVDSPRYNPWLGLVYGVGAALVIDEFALLLNLRDVQENVITLLPALGVASMRAISDALEIPYGEFLRLWNELPLEDAAVAARLGLTRQQVINLRKSARERLTRRMKDF